MPRIPDETLMPRRAYSYSRVSEYKPQSTSIERQETFAEKICREEGWTLDDTLVFVDKNRSGFKGHNRKPTADLTRCLKEIEKKKIAPGSVIIIENIDRLSREEVDVAYDLFRGILKAGVWIATEEPRRIYKPGPQDFVALLEPLWQMYLAHAESKKKSVRIRAQWIESRKTAHEGGGPTMHKPPHWVALGEEGWQAIPERVTLWERICSLLVKGVGTGRVAELLNDEGVPTPTGRGTWRGSTIRVLVRGRTLLGEYQPGQWIDGKYVPDGNPVPVFWPAAVEADLLELAQVAVKRFKGAGGRPTRCERINVLKGLARCAATRRNLSIQNRDDQYGKRAYLVVGNVAGTIRVDYDVVLETILATVRQLTPADVLPPDAARDERERTMAQLAHRISGLTQRQRVLADALTDETQDALVILESLASVKKQLMDVTTERDRLQLETTSGRAEALGEAQSLAELRGATEGEERRQLDLEIAAALPLVVRRVDVTTERVNRYAQIVRLAIHLHNGETRQVKIDSRGRKSPPRTRR